MENGFINPEFSLSLFLLSLLKNRKNHPLELCSIERICSNEVTTGDWSINQPGPAVLVYNVVSALTLAEI